MVEWEARGWRGYRVAALILLAVKLALLVLAHPFMDETYYWMWGQHPALSYLDHPPLIGWVAALSAPLGWSIFSLRFGVLLTLLGDLALLALFARLDARDWRARFWPTALIFVATPMLFGLTSVALPDHLLIFFCLLALYAWERFRRAWLDDAPRWRWLYLAAAAIGLATLSKYNGITMGLGVLAHVLSTPKLRPLVRHIHFYLAALVVVGFEAPVLIWNTQHEFASFRFLVGARSGLGPNWSLAGVVGYILGAFAVLSPFALWAMLRFALARGTGQGLARIVFWLSSLGFLAASAATNILVHWNAVAYAAVLPFVGAWFRPRWMMWAQVAYGALAIGVAGVNYAVLPVTAIAGSGDQTSAWSYGWDMVAARVRALRESERADFIAATDYALAAPLGFALADPKVTSLSSNREAYDDWFEAAAHAGEDAILVSDRWRPLRDDLRAHFDSVAEAAEVEVSRFGRSFDRYVLYVARGYRP